MLQITPDIVLQDEELDWQAIRAQGAGGQNVNKVSSALHLRFNIATSSLDDALKQRLLALRDQRITADGILVIKAQRFRTQEKNRVDAIERLRELIVAASHVPKRRRPTKPSKSSQRKRMDSKTKRGATKRLRRGVEE
ncbi:MAG: aminoacyl-tRNA hydrolase [Chromatiaceae bacterium]|nr:aminoacyl-tRNA hydrolase [Chromatiaceae bacterium]MCP5430153.1 aminoacyl-tRNA hydrolase [Chromatiaceae bacterium]MCP5435929.1 aminoacyl-tRNA hydrolase [Chromatiaceae bacterium]MCW5586542.1 aminoacyl-tRNA hydrolase [Chromatiales bacterium]HPQ25929.1 alternative ribosome rescue aminoacyl-tRNA hydrolase ArfB [Gammaproteobacteria bacterium]